MTLVSLELNPKFLFHSPATGTLDRSRLAEHVDRAIIALDARAPIGGDCWIELLRSAEATGAQTLTIEIWVSDLDDYTCTYGFLVSSEDRRTPFARGERVVVNIDPASRRPLKWTPEFRASHAGLLKDLPAYA